MANDASRRSVLTTAKPALSCKSPSQTLGPFGGIRSDTALLSVLADGNIRGVATGGSRESTTGTGSLGIGVEPRVYYSALLSIASRADSGQGGPKCDATPVKNWLIAIGVAI